MSSSQDENTRTHVHCTALLLRRRARMSIVRAHTWYHVVHLQDSIHHASTSCVQVMSGASQISRVLDPTSTRWWICATQDLSYVSSPATPASGMHGAALVLYNTLVHTRYHGTRSSIPTIPATRTALMSADRDVGYHMSRIMDQGSRGSGVSCP